LEGAGSLLPLGEPSASDWCLVLEGFGHFGQIFWIVHFDFLLGRSGRPLPCVGTIHGPGRPASKDLLLVPDVFIGLSGLCSFQDILEKALALKGTETSNYELEFRTKTNKIRYLLVKATTCRDDESNIVGVVGVAQDLTEAEKRDRAVAAMAHELRQLVDTANAPIFGIDVHGNVNASNDKTADITGFSKEEALKKPLVSTFIVPDLRKSVQDILEKALKGIETSNYYLEFHTKTNEIRYLLVNATTRRDDESNIVGVVGVAQDVTEAEKRDRAVAAMARELRQLVDTANAPIFGIDVHGNVNEWNDKTAKINGFSKEEAVHRPLVSTFVEPKLRKSVQDVLEKALNGTETSNYELEFRTKTLLPAGEYHDPSR
jgi:PAS domain S-box-containing protein